MGTGGSKAVQADDDNERVADADFKNAANHYDSPWVALDAHRRNEIMKSLTSVANVAAKLRAGDVELRLIEGAEGRALDGSGVANVLTSEDRRNACRIRSLAVAVGILLPVAITLAAFLGVLLHQAKADDGTTGGGSPPTPDGAAELLATWRDLPEDEFWQRLIDLATKTPPALVDFSFIVFTQLELARAEAPWEEKLRQDASSKSVTSAERTAVRTSRGDELFAMAEAALTALTKGADLKAATLPQQSMIDVLGQVKDLAYQPATRADGSAYLGDDADKKLTRREKLLVLHYAANQALRLLGQKADIVYELLWTLDANRYWTAEETLAFSDLKLDANPLAIVLHPMTADIAQVAWSFSPPTPPATDRDNFRPYFYLTDVLKDGTRYTIDATLTFRPSPALNAAAGTSLDKPPVKLSAWFTVDNSGV